MTSRGAALIVLSVLVASSAWAESTGFARLHFGMDLGYYKAFHGDVPASRFDSYDERVDAYSAMDLRVSFSSLVDMAIDVRGWRSPSPWEGGGDKTTSCWLAGFGVRLNSQTGGFLQCNLYSVHEKVNATVFTPFQCDTVLVAERSIGVGVIAGVESSRRSLVSLSLELNMLLAKPRDNISGLGITLGFNLNFGPKEEY